MIENGLPSKKRAAIEHPGVKDWGALPQPSLETIRIHRPRAQIWQGSYSVPTFIIHGTAVDLIPWQQTKGTHQTLNERGIKTDLGLIEGALHTCDTSSDPKSDQWKGYIIICSYV